MKKALSLVLSMLLLCGVLSPCVAAADTATTPGTATLTFERTGGAIANVLGQLLKVITLSDESRIKKASPRDAAGVLSEKTLFNGSAEQALTAETWRMVELSFESEKSYDDPFSDVTLDLLLYGNSRRYTVPCFWDGGNTWRVRFVCPAAGNWQCMTVCSDKDNAALHGRTATVDCKAYSGELEIYQHGFVTTRYGEKSLTYDDGKPFFYLGDTHWNFGTEPLDVVQTVAAKRASQGFTVWQSEPNGSFGPDYDLTDNVTQADIDGLRALDARYKIVADCGLVHANAQFFFPPSMNALIASHGGYSTETISGLVSGHKKTTFAISDEAKEYLERLSRYWVARFGAYPVIWTLGQEVDNDFYDAEYSKGEWNSLNHPYKLVADYITKYDPYAQAVTAHQESTGNTVAYGNGLGTGEVHMIYYFNGTPSAFRDVPGHTMYAAQWSPPLDKRDDCVSSKDFWYNGQGKPVVNYEGRYCYYWTKDFGARMQGWASFLSGLYGYGWGSQGTWYYTDSFNPEPASFDGVDIVTEEEKVNVKWRDALEMKSADQVGHMRRFFEQIDWQNLVPRFHNWAYFVPSSNVLAYCASNKKNTEMVVYFYTFSDPAVAAQTNAKKNGGILTGTVGSLVPFAKYNYQWFDPIHGTTIDSGTFRASAIGTWFAGTRPDDTDLVLLIQKA